MDELLDEEFDELFELELLDEFEELFDDELLDELDELFEEEFELELLELLELPPALPLAPHPPPLQPPPPQPLLTLLLDERLDELFEDRFEELFDERLLDMPELVFVATRVRSVRSDLGAAAPVISAGAVAVGAGWAAGANAGP